MAHLVPIRGIRYTPAAGSLDTLLAPPYDVISEDEHRRLLERSPRNAIRLELAAGADRYGAAAETKARWLADGVLARDVEPSFYVYEQEFAEQGNTLQRRALLAGVEAQPWEAGAVKPHEYTMSGPKEDRLRLLESTRIQFSPVFMIARDRAGRLREFLAATTGRPPDQEARLADGLHRTWVLEAGRNELRQLAPLISESFYIADGHHRYETAVTYKLARLSAGEQLGPDHPARFVLAGIVAADDPGLVIRPIHRVVPRPAPSDWRARLAERFTVEDIDVGADATATAAAILEARPDAIIAAGLAPGRLQVLVLNDLAGLTRRIPAGHSDTWAAIQPNVVRYGILEPLWSITDEALRAGAVDYTHDEREALDAVARNPGSAVALLIHAVSVHDVLSLADRGERMPQKSTFFHPKLGTGLVFHPLDP